MNWSDPKARHLLLQRVGHTEYHRLQQQNFAATTVTTVSGHTIRPVGSRFGRLFMVGQTRQAFRTLDQARAYAAKFGRNGPVVDPENNP